MKKSQQEMWSGILRTRLCHLTTVYTFSIFVAICPFLAAAIARPAPAIPENVSLLQGTSGRPDYQAVALASFAAGLEADPYAFFPLWIGDSHPCGDESNNFQPWPGVQCNAPTGFVIALQLRGKSLKGTLPNALATLRSLRTLDLSNNSFYGSLPASYSNMTFLEQVDLSFNRLNGSLPDTWSSLTALQALDLRSNQLTGPLPASWAGMNQLEVLDASNNKLTSTLPSAWSRLSCLSILDLHNNSLTGTLPSAWADQRSLLQLNLGANGMIGGLPQQWASGMDSLRGVNITDNSLSGSLPEEWANMTSLQALSMGSNRLTGSIPATWAKLTNLYVVNVTRNEGICGVLPTGVPQNMVEGASTTSLNNTCSWEGDAHPLQEWKAGLQDTIDVLASWKQGTNPCGAIAWQGVLCDGWSVVSIQLPYAGLKGPISEGLMRLASLRSLQLNNNQLSGTLPLWQDAPHSLNIVNLASNNLHGTLPANWSQSLLSVQLLNLSSNALQGELPDSWAAFNYLITLDLSSNPNLNSTLPPSWAGLPALRQLQLDHCNISGSIPASWGKLTQVKEISLSMNLLVGSVPTPLISNPSLTYLDLSGNQQMCGELQQSSVNVQKALTGIGQQCKVAYSMPLVTGVVVGVCSSFGGALLIAGAVFAVIRCKARAARRQSPHDPQEASGSAGNVTVPPEGPSSHEQLSSVASNLSGTFKSAPAMTLQASAAGHLGGSCSLPQQQQSRLAKMATPPASPAGPLGDIDLRTALPARMSESHRQARSSAAATADKGRPISGLAAPPASAAGSVHHSPSARSLLPVPGTAAIAAYKAAANVLDPYQPHNLPQSPVIPSRPWDELYTQAGVYHKKCASAPCSPRSGNADGAWSAAGSIYEHGRSVMSPFHIMQEASTCSLVPELNQSMTQFGLPTARQQFPNAVGAGPPVTADEQQQVYASSHFDSFSTGPSPSGSPSQIGSDVAASSPRGMAALLAAGGSSEASSHAAAEGAASKCTQSDEIITAPNGS